MGALDSGRQTPNISREFILWTVCSSALLRRPGVAIPGLLGGLTFALVSLTMTGFTFYEVTGTIMTFHERLIQMIAVPFTVGAVGTLWRGRPLNDLSN